ncbi:MAG TPA: sialidase family protein [Casimicrobiaceae bacterium]
MRLASVVVAGLLAVGLNAQLRAETVVEYYNATLDHYFMTPLANEIAALDSGQIAGWSRTGATFDGSATADTGESPVCRFYIPPIHGDSHFLSASPAECAAVVAKIGTDPNFSGYIEETAAEFYIALPDTASGTCPAGTQPVYRLWNGRADSNHRYTADTATRDAMIARGYIPEGYGPQGVAMCTTHAIAPGDVPVRLTGRTPFPDGCDRPPVPDAGTVYTGAEVEPQIATDPRDPSHLIGVWQQDRWSDGGARGLRTAYSFDAGATWSYTQAAFTHCTGGNAGNGGDYPRASDPWVSIGPDGTAYQVGIAFIGDTLAPGSSSAVLASRSTDGGRTWSAPATVILDGSAFFNDKESVTADPFVAGSAYATWDRLEQANHGPSWFSRTTDGGATWEAPRAIYDPGMHNQTLNNQVVVTKAGNGNPTLLDFFSELDLGQNNLVTTHLALVRSDDRGSTWSAPIVVSDIRAVGAYDPQNPAHTLRDAANLASFARGPDGTLVAVWQDARFSHGLRDGIAFSRSTDGGATWSAPVEINRVPAVQAFLPAVAIGSDGTIGVLYYDMRNDTADPATLLVDLWFATSTDGTTWSEGHVAGPFDFDNAPSAEGGLFIGDYQGLASADARFAALFAQANDDATNRTDIFESMVHSLPIAVAKSTYRVREAPEFAMTPAFQAKLDATARKTLRQRVVGLAPPALHPQQP